MVKCSPRITGNMFSCTKHQRGFSLVELSIVLVILGLLTGGILTGQSLIRAAELRSMTTQLNVYRSAVFTFRDKYFALPGDMRNATDFWGSAGGNGSDAACLGVESTSTATCNGNSDGYLWRNGVGGVYDWGERFHFWKQLANAGMIEGSYTGRTDSTSVDFVVTPGKNSPLSKFSAMEVRVFGSPVGEGANRFELRPTRGQLKPEEAWNVDKKLDDGLPLVGKLLTLPQSHVTYPNCASSDDPATSVYNLNNETANCALSIFW